MILFDKMKKALSILMCYAIGMVAFTLNASTPVSVYSSIDFSNQSLWGKTPHYGLDDKGGEGTQEQKFWWCFGEGNVAIIKDYEGDAERYNRFGAAFGGPNPQPSYMKSGRDNSGFVDFLNADPLARTFNPIHPDGASDAVVLPEENGLFVDTLVRFEPCETADVPAADVDGRAKFICWLSAPAGVGETNLVVTAGRYAADGRLTRVNYVVTNQVEAGRWYRLTARAIRNAATNGRGNAPCFALYLDGLPVSCAEGDYRIGEDRAAMDDLFVGNDLYAARALFPPIRAFDSTPKLAGFAVQGCGGYDEFGVVNEGNPLAYEVETIDFVVAMSTNAVTNVICTVTAEGADEPYFTTNSTGEAEVAFTVAPGDSVHVEALCGSVYSLATELSLAGNVSAVDRSRTKGYDVTMISGETFRDDSKLIARINVGNAYFRVGDAVYESIEDAMDAANEQGEPLVLENDVTLDPNFSINGQMRVLPTYELALDLHGRKLKGQNFREEATIYDQGRLTVYDSIGGGMIEAEGTAIEIVSTNDAVEANNVYADLMLGSEVVRSAAGFKVRGRVRCTKGVLRLLDGTYLTPWNLEPTNDFYLAGYVAPDKYGSEKVESPESIAGRDCYYWRVVYDGRRTVRFEAEIGACDPAFVHVDAGGLLTEPAVTNAAGYTVTNWYDTATGASWDFASDTVQSNLTLRAQQRLDVYTITYDVPEITEPSSYTVDSLRRELPTAERDLYTFGGWKDRATGLFVKEVGIGATFVGTETTVTGDLELVAQWIPNTLTWSNTSAGNSESNGTYSGSWSFRIPAGAGLVEGATVVIDEIDFCIVNPHLYPKTSAHLAVTPAEGVQVISGERIYRMDDSTKEYLVGADEWLANGRAKVGYLFTGLKVKVGAANEVRFTDAAGESVKGFLRLALKDGRKDALFGNCTEPGGDPESEEYGKFCPLYEITAHPEEVNGD